MGVGAFVVEVVDGAEELVEELEPDPPELHPVVTMRSSAATVARSAERFTGRW